MDGLGSFHKLSTAKLNEILYENYLAPELYLLVAVFLL
ncbi:hypothetical protein R078138_00537 [Convivina praedatoris]|uniref:Uncharacterized protein n=1 Tax=Convivina praedatoris TaxID=2880963 RepID=A0ABN8HC05_9LACO|nr:hypothetical protein LMG032447_00527 [Convivina sp. LMG 32447]CAH1852266.1 hypothetical protein R078138_00537 [Convivina sp. LMG 32447]CAH1852684.1 hypothetical protein R077815_00580 [Convivina sp. LMG 32447]